VEIIVNTRLLLPGRLEGIGWFEFETLKRITRNHPNDHFIFLFDRDCSEEFLFSDNITPLILSPQARHPFLYYLWFEFSVAGVLNKLKPDLFLSPDGYLSLRSDCRQLPVIHDINFEHYPGDIPFLEQKYYRRFFPRFAKKASRIATVSEFSKNDISRHYDIDPSKIDVVYNGCSNVFGPTTGETKKATREKYACGEEYFLFVGALHPRKNISRLLEAFDRFRKTQSSRVKLVIVGKKYYWTSEIKRTYINMQFKDEVIFTGRLSPEELAKVTASALALTYVPYFEGFGVPVLEAMNSDVPVITSNVTSMPEVADGAALLVDPFSVDAICNAMLYLWKDEDMRKNLVEKGRKRRLDFSWDKSADLLWKSISRTVGEGK
jgi:glycosyltransferase involved in cell wall biosynthesis